jgi:hypothetical protein
MCSGSHAINDRSMRESGTFAEGIAQHDEIACSMAPPDPAAVNPACRDAISEMEINIENSS